MEEELRQKPEQVSSTNAGSTNAGSTNADSTNAGSMNADSTNAGSTNADSTNAGSTNADSTNATERSSLEDVIDGILNLPERDWSQYSPLTLAWIGDTVYDLIIRTVLLKRGMMQPDKLHRRASKIVNARAQSELMKKIRDQLTDRETSIYRRGRNAKPAHKAKNSDMKDYLEATGFECLIGYLYLTRQNSRIMELIMSAGDVASS